MNNSSFGRGIFFAAAAFILWGILPVYWKLLAAIKDTHLLALRIILSLILVAAILLIQKKYAWLAVFKDRKKGFLLILAALALSANWGLFIWAVNKGHTIEASLGYYINPLVSIALGLIFFREKLKSLQWAAFGLAAAGVLTLTFMSGSFPWISMGLALTFGVYGLFKKTNKLSALESLGAETLAAAPAGLFLLLFSFRQNGSGLSQIVPGWQDLSYLASLPVHTLIILSLCGAVTSFPLYCFSRGAKILPLSTLGFIQFFTPTLQFLAGYFLFTEYFPAQYFAAFTCIWLAVILYIISLKVQREGVKNV